MLNKIWHFLFTMLLKYFKPQTGTPLLPHLKLSTIPFHPTTDLNVQYLQLQSHSLLSWSQDFIADADL